MPCAQIFQNIVIPVTTHSFGFICGLIAIGAAKMIFVWNPFLLAWFFNKSAHLKPLQQSDLDFDINLYVNVVQCCKVHTNPTPSVSHVALCQTEWKKNVQVDATPTHGIQVAPIVGV